MSAIERPTPAQRTRRLAVLAGLYSGISAVVATAIYAVCLLAMLTASTVYNLTRPCAARPSARIRIRSPPASSAPRQAAASARRACARP